MLDGLVAELIHRDLQSPMGPPAAFPLGGGFPVLAVIFATGFRSLGGLVTGACLPEQGLLSGRVLREPFPLGGVKPALQQPDGLIRLLQPLKQRLDPGARLLQLAHQRLHDRCQGIIWIHGGQCAFSTEKIKAATDKFPALSNHPDTSGRNGPLPPPPAVTDGRQIDAGKQQGQVGRPHLQAAAGGGGLPEGQTEGAPLQPLVGSSPGPAAG